MPAEDTRKAARPLLAPDEPPPTRLLRPRGTSDLVLIADHAGRLIPRSLGTLGLPESELDRHIAWDIGIAGVAERLSTMMDATAILQAYSRLVIDCNRQPGVDSSIPTLSETTEIPGNQSLSPAEAEARRAAVFEPYHARIAAVLDARAKAGRRSVLIALHSFTPVYMGTARPMQAAVLYNRDPRLARLLLRLLRAEPGFIVGDNDPYSVSDESDYSIPVHGERRGLPHVELEIRQDLIGDEIAQGVWASRLAKLLTRADAQLRVIESR